MLYNIAGIIVEFIGSNDLFEERGAIFKMEASDTSASAVDLIVKSEKVDNIVIPDGDLILDETSRWYRKKAPDNGFFIAMTSTRNLEFDTILEADYFWRNISIRYIESDLTYPISDNRRVKWNDYHTFQLTGIAYRNAMISMDSITVHSSSFAIDGKGVIVSAPSGTGKSTHTGLWKERYGDRVTLLNDDRPVIRFLEGKPMLCGTPWSGSTDIFANLKVPLEGVVMLTRSSENRIERLDMARALEMLMPRCFLPYFDGGLMEATIKVIEKLVETVPVYLLQCRPDYEAVELVYKCMSL